jgi:bifunctional UDP-N-acetylglucosamine pyrophosphorylase / glucosamine-1-phosphate N-acetyltransferase
MQNDKVKIVILAGGKGKRMESDLPKVLLPLHGKPMIRHILDPLIDAFPEKPITVVGHKKELVQQELGDLSFYAEQKEPLGTGHSVSCARGECKNAEHVVVLSGDQPFIKIETVKKLIQKHLASGAKITFTTTEPDNFENWRKAFLQYGRILRKK